MCINRRISIFNQIMKRDISWYIDNTYIKLFNNDPIKTFDKRLLNNLKYNIAWRLQCLTKILNMDIWINIVNYIFEYNSESVISVILQLSHTYNECNLEMILSTNIYKKDFEIIANLYKTNIILLQPDQYENNNIIIDIFDAESYSTLLIYTKIIDYLPNLDYMYRIKHLYKNKVYKSIEHEKYIKEFLITYDYNYYILSRNIETLFEQYNYNKQINIFEETKGYTYQRIVDMWLKRDTFKLKTDMKLGEYILLLVKIAATIGGVLIILYKKHSYVISTEPSELYFFELYDNGIFKVSNKGYKSVIKGYFQREIIELSKDVLVLQ